MKKLLASLFLLGSVLAFAAGEQRVPIEKIDIFDVYSGDKIDKDKKSVAMSIVLRDKNRTLTDEDIDKAMNTILELIKDKYNGEIRK